MSTLIPPHGNGRPEALAAARGAAGGCAEAGAHPEAAGAFEPRGFGPLHARHGRVHAARRLHGRSRLARRVPRHAPGERALLAAAHHAFLRRGFWHRRRRRGGADGRGRGDPRYPHGHREIRHRQGPRMPRGLPHRRRGPPRRGQGDGAGRGQPGGPGLGALRRATFPRPTGGSTCAPPRPGRCSPRKAGRRSPPSRPATPCTEATSSSPRWRSRSATGC